VAGISMWRMPSGDSALISALPTAGSAPRGREEAVFKFDLIRIGTKHAAGDRLCLRDDLFGREMDRRPAECRRTRTADAFADRHLAGVALHVMHLVRVDAEPVARQLLVDDLVALTLGRAAIWEGLLQRLRSQRGRYSGCAKSCQSGVRFRTNVKSEGVMKSFTILAIMLAGVLDASSGVSAALITNGSFETPIVPIGNFTDFAVGSSGVTGWNVFGPAGAT
jgi:hypothetical protein